MPRPIDPPLNHLIHLLYQGPMEATPWQGFLDNLRELFVADVASLTVVSTADSDGESRLLSRASIPENWPGFDMSRWAAFDPFIHIELDRVVSLTDLMDAGELKSSRYFQEILVPASIHHVLGVDIAAEDEQPLKIRVRVTRGERQLDFGAYERAVLASLVGHLKQALRYFTALSIGRIERNVFADAINQLMFGVFILDSKGRITASNRVARETIAKREELGVEGGVLRLASRALNNELYATLNAIGQGTLQGSIPRIISLPGQGGCALSLMVRPIRTEDISKYPIQSLAVIFLSEPMGMQDISVATLKDLFGLTSAEARMAVLLANGFTIEEAAEKLGVSKNTAKTHSRMVYEKTGVSRQVKLIQLISNSVARVSA